MDGDDELEVDYFILENIYLDLCRKIVKGYDLKYSSNYIYFSTMPDFIEGNEDKFIDHKSDIYVRFINSKIEHYINNKDLYKHKPAIIVLLKIIEIFDNEQEDDELIILYNRLLHMINYMTPAYLFINEEYIKKDDGYELLTHRTVQESSIVQVYEHLPLIDDFKNFVRVIFSQDKENNDILISELNYIYTNYDMEDEKYRILKEVLAIWHFKVNIM